jgi:hypothetical protein
MLRVGVVQGKRKFAKSVLLFSFTFLSMFAFAEASDAFSIPRAEFAKYYKAVTGKPVPQNAVSFAIDPAVSKTGKDAYKIVSSSEFLVSSSGAQIKSLKPETRNEKPETRNQKPETRNEKPETPCVTITGSNMRSVMYGVYDLLERRAGCRWFWDGDRVPKREKIDLAGLDVREEARFEYRALRYFAHRGLTRFQAEHWGPADWKREIDWMLKRRLNCFMPRIGMDDTWQKAFPDIVPYPDPAEPSYGRLPEYHNRISGWGLRYRGELRKLFTDYAFARGLMIPTDFGTMTHWYSLTPEPFLKRKNPPFLPHSGGAYSDSDRDRVGLVWDVFQGEWLDDYWHLTEAFINAGYGSPDLLHTIGLGERMCYNDRAKNLQLKKDVLALMTKKALAKYPDSKILLAGWDFYCTWKPEEVKSLLPELDPERTIIWDYEAEAESGVDSFQPRSDNNFTQWGVVGKFPYTFGIFLAYEAALDIRAHYDVIEEREKVAAADPFCKGYILWPESSHTDTFLLSYFTANAWRPGRSHDALLPVFCRDRYGDKATAFEPLWRAVLPMAKLLGWGGNWGSLLLGLACFKDANLDAMRSILSAVPSIFAGLAAITPEDDFQRRDIVDIARTSGDRLAIWIQQRLLLDFLAWCDGSDNGDSIRFWCGRYLDIVKANTEIISLHTDFSLCESLDRLAEEAPIFGKNFDKVLLDNASNGYCRSHQYEIAAGCYIPFAEAFVREVLRRIDAGERARIPDEWTAKTREACLADLKGRGIEAYRPSSPRTPDEYRRILTAARDVSAKVF